MVAEQKTAEQRGKRRAASTHAKLVRRSLLIDPDVLDRLCERLGTADRSVAVREAIDRTLLVEEGRDLGEWLAARNGLIDVYGPPPPLPDAGDPEDEIAINNDDTLRR